VHGLYLAIGTAHGQFREGFRDFFGYQPVLNRLGPIAVGLRVPKRHRPQLQQPPARVGHVADVFLEAAGRGGGAKLAVHVNQHRDGGRARSRDASYAPNDCLGVRPLTTEVDGVRFASDASDEGSQIDVFRAVCRMISGQRS